MAEPPVADQDQNPGSLFLEEKRAELDAIDRAILELVARRRALVAELFAEKRRRALPLIDPARERTLLNERRSSAERLGVPPDLAERIFQAILDGSHAEAAAPSEIVER